MYVFVSEIKSPLPGTVVVLAVLPAVWTNDIYDCPQKVLAHRARQVSTDEMVQNIIQCLEYKQNKRKARQNLGYLPPAGQNVERLHPHKPSMLKLNETHDLSTDSPTVTTYESSVATVSQSESSSSTPCPQSSHKNLDNGNSGNSLLQSSSPQPSLISDNNSMSQNFDYTTPSTEDETLQSTNLSDQPSNTPSYKQTNPPPTTLLDEIYETGDLYNLTESPVTSISNDSQLRPTEQPSTTDFKQLTLIYQPDSSENNEVRHYKPSLTEPPVTNRPITSNPSTNPTIATSTISETEKDKRPQIHAIDVQCAKDMMTVKLEFKKVYNGIIYSKGFFSNSNCRYVQENSNQVKYTFTLSLNSCGTEFINGFDTQGQSYLENVLVLQNDIGFQEVRDIVRSVRCLWEGNINKQLSVALSVGLLNQEIVTFSGDTAMASLDIQVGKGPFAQPANGLIKIGKIMTLVISINGDSAFDIQVKGCVARNADSKNVVRLTDDDGCVLKPKLFGAFQKTRETGNTGASIIAYSYFTAFKFPDAIDLIMECSVELCKINCDISSECNQKLEPGSRRRRDIFAGYNTLADTVRVKRSLKVIVPEDISFSEPLGICLSYAGFSWGAAIILFTIFTSCIIAGFVWLKLQKHSHCKNHM